MEIFYPYVDKIFHKCCSFKHQGNEEQQEKGIRMLQSRKIVTAETIHEQSGIYDRAMIKKSYGTTIRSAVVLFQNSLPQKATYSCPVGLSGLYCHILALLLFLKNSYRNDTEDLKKDPSQWFRWNKSIQNQLV